jgi:hypothetical protein
MRYNAMCELKYYRINVNRVMLRKIFRPFIFQKCDISRIIDSVQKKEIIPNNEKMTNNERILNHDLNVVVIMKSCFIILGMSFSSILLIRYLSRNKK